VLALYGGREVDMEYKKDDKVLVVHDWSRPVEVKEGTITKNSSSKQEYVEVDGQLLSGAYIFPPSAREDIMTVVMKRAALKEAYDDSMKLVYEVCNRKSRGEYK
jgi:hypothetical protein